MEFLPADYALGAVVIISAVVGLFRGLSGMLGFCVACAVAGAVARLGWPYSEAITTVPWQRMAGVLLVSLLAFGLVRLVVKKLAHGLLAQPTDAVFGLVMGILVGCLPTLVWALLGLHVEYSNLVQWTQRFVS